MTDDEYTSKFLELLRYVPYLTEDKAKIKRFTSGLPIAFKDMIEFDEPRSLEEAIRKLKHCYEKSKLTSKTKRDQKGNEKNKEKWDKKRIRPQDTGNKDNVEPPKKFNASDRGQGFHFEEQNMGDGRKPLQCWTCGKYHHMRDYPQHQGGKPQIYSAKEAQIEYSTDLCNIG